MPERYAYFFKSFSHESRNKILRLLAANGEMTVESLAEAMEIKASTVSRHLGILKMQGVVGMRIESPAHYYYLEHQAIKEKFKDFLCFLKIK